MGVGNDRIGELARLMKRRFSMRCRVGSVRDLAREFSSRMWPISDLPSRRRFVDSARIPDWNLTRLHRLGTDTEDAGLNPWRLHVSRWLSAFAPPVLFVILELSGSRLRLLR